MSYEYNYLGEEEENKGHQCPKIDLHLNSPILSGLNILFIDALKLHPRVEYNPEISTNKLSYVRIPSVASKSAQTLLSLVGNKDKLMSKLEDNIYPVMSHIFTYTYTKTPGAKEWLPKKAKMISGILMDIIRGYDPRLTSEFEQSAELYFNEQEESMYAIKMSLEDVRDIIVRKAESRIDEWSLLPLPTVRYPNILVNKSMCLVIESPIRVKSHMHMNYSIMQNLLDNATKVHVCNYEHLLCMLDTMIGRLYTMYSHRLIHSKFKFKIPADKLTAVYKVFDQGLAKFHNDMYNQIKIFESLVYSIIIEKTDITDIKKEFHEYLLKSSIEDQYELIAVMDDLLQEFSVPQLAEVFGIYRHWGHPVVDEAAGCKKVKDIIKTRRPACQKTMTEIAGQLVKQFVLEFIAQHNRWPNCNTEEVRKESPLHNLVKSNDRNLSDYHSQISIQDWSKLRVIGELEFDYHIDYTDLLNDKAIAPLASENDTSYHYHVTGVPTSKPTTTRRVLSEIMERERLSVKEICQLIQRGEIPSSWWIIKLSPKEREVNIKPRLFAMMVLEMRLYFCVTESNISKRVFKYFPQQSMTLDEEKLSRRLINMSGSKGTTLTLELTLGIDFKSWNIHWSLFNTRDVSKLLDDWFDCPGLFSFGHLFFAGSEVTLSSKFLVPEFYMSKKHPHLILPDGLYRWLNHMGGLEGIMQKLWTLITIGILLVVEARTGIKSTIIGQGDNQICKLKIPVGDVSMLSHKDRMLANQIAIKNAKETFLSVLNEVSAAIGIELKPLESWASDSTMIYSKEIYVNGANASQLSKRVGRTMADVNDDYPTCSVRLGTIQTAGYSAVQKTYIMAIPWFVAQMEACLTLLRDAEVCSVLSKDKATMSQALHSLETVPMLRFFLLSCGEFTGIPTLSLMDYEFRGHPDPLTTYLSFIYKMRDSETSTPEIKEITAKLLTWFKDCKFPVGVASPELLVCNPTATNIKTPAPLSRSFKSEVFNYLSNNSRNVDVKELFNATTEQFDKEFYQYLISSEPLYPRLLNVISTHSPTGSRLYMISKFTNTKTLQGMSFGGAKFGSAVMIQESDFNFYIHMLKTYVQIQKLEPYFGTDICSTHMADHIREVSYKSLLGDRKYIGVTMPHPSHVLKIVYDDVGPGDEYISVLAPESYSFANLLEAGNQPAFVGTKTMEKTSGRIVTISGKSRPFDDACRLKRAQEWAVDKESPFYDYLSDLISCRTNVPHDIISGMSGISYFGSHIHRVGDAATKKETKNTIRHSATTFFALSSDKLGLTTRGGDDFNLQVSGLYHYAIHDIIKKCIADPSYQFRYLRAYRTNDCCHTAYDNAPTACLVPGPPITLSKSNPLLYADITTFKSMVTPQSCLITYVDGISSSDAIGYYMMSRFKGITSHALITIQAVKAPYITRISMSEVLNVGLLAIVRSFAKYLYLYIGDKYVTTRVFLPDMQSDLWCGISELCLVPSVMEQLMSILDIDGSDNCYKHNNRITKLLNEMLVKELDRIHMTPTKSVVYPEVKFFLLNNVKFVSVFLMWWYYVKMTTTMDERYYEGVKYSMLEVARTTQDWNSTMRTVIKESIHHDYAETLWRLITTTKRIKLMRKPPEFYFRDPISLSAVPPIQVEPRTERKIDPALMTEIYTHNYPIPSLILTEPISDVWSEVSLETLTMPEDTILKVRRTRLDQIGRTRGTLTTAYLKYMQMIIKENIIFANPAICTADGEAGVAHAISCYSNMEVYYNSLQSRDIQTQRYESFVPGSFLRDREKIKGHQLSLIYGGDLTDMGYLRRFVEVIPQHSSLLTCDADVSGLYDPVTKIRIINALLLIIIEKQPHACIWKEYIDNPMMLAATISNLRLYYMDVKIVTPAFSSFENRECFIVAQVLRFKLDRQPKITDALYVEDNFRKYLIKIQNYQKMRISQTLPFISRQDNIRRAMLLIGEQLGYHSNLRHTLYCLTNMFAPEDITPRKVSDWLTVCIQAKISNMEKLAAIFSTLSSDRSLKLPWDSASRLAVNPCASQTMDRDTEAITCCYILKAVIEESTIQEAYQVYLNCFESLPNKIIYNETVIYDYTIRDIPKWESRHLKYIWRVWGHVNANNN